MTNLLIISGPTATGKTGLGLELAQKFNGELVSADSRQVYTGLDIVTGKDLPPSINYELSTISWRNRKLKFYLIDGVKVWLYDIVNPNEEFNVSFWKECADLVIKDIRSRGKLPIIVGGTGLYLKSLTQNLDKINIVPNHQLRKELSGKSVEYLQDKLSRLNPEASAYLNSSDRKNPRRLIRAIEIALQSSPSIRLEGDLPAQAGKGGELLNISLTAPKDYLNTRIDRRVEDRLKLGAVTEITSLFSKYSPSLSCFSASGYRAYSQPDFVSRWKILEHQYARRQLTWFKKQPRMNWFDITNPEWKSHVFVLVDNWYNNSNAKES